MTGMKQSSIHHYTLQRYEWISRYKLELLKGGSLLAAEGFSFQLCRRGSWRSSALPRVRCVRWAAWLLAWRGCLYAAKGFLGRASTPERLNRDFAIVSTAFITGDRGSVYSFVVNFFFPQKLLCVFPPLLSFPKMADPCSFWIHRESRNTFSLN